MDSWLCQSQLYWPPWYHKTLLCTELAPSCDQQVDHVAGSVQTVYVAALQPYQPTFQGCESGFHFDMLNILTGNAGNSSTGSSGSGANVISHELNKELLSQH